MVMTRAMFQSLLEEGLRKVFFSSLKEKDMVYPKIFEVTDSKKRKESDQSIAGIGMLLEKLEGEPTVYDDMVEGYSVEYIHKTYSKGIRITQEMIEDELYGQMNKRSAALARSANYRLEYDHASLFNNANNTTVFTGGDTKALLATDHPLFAAAGVTVSNTASTDLSLAALETAELYFNTMVDDRNMLIPMRPKTLVIPPQLKFDAWELLQSGGKPGTADNDRNWFGGKYDIVVWDFLTDSDSWFLLSDKSYGAPISFKRTPISYKRDGDFDTDDLKMKCRTRYSFGFSDWRWVYGSMGG